MKIKQSIKKYFITLSIVLLSFPILAFSQFSSSVTACDTSGSSLLGSDFSCTIYRIVEILYLIVPLLSAAAFIVFFWGLSKFILGTDNKADIEKGKNYMLWGILALFILLTFRTIVGLIISDLDVQGVDTNNPNTILLPT